MIQAKCIQKFRDKNNNIYGYRLQDSNGQTQDVQSNNLKQAIATGQIHVVNLTLTKDGRLVDSTEKQLKSKELRHKQYNNNLTKSLIIVAKAIPDAHYISDTLGYVSDLSVYNLTEDNLIQAINNDNTKIVKYINSSFSDETLQEDEYAFENFEVNLKNEVLENKNSIINALKELDSHKEIGVDTANIKRFIADCNLSKLKFATSVLEKLCDILIDACENEEQLDDEEYNDIACKRTYTFERVSVYKETFHFDGIIDLTLVYNIADDYQWADENEVIAVVKDANETLLLQHIEIDEDTRKNKVIKSFKLDTQSIDKTLHDFKIYFIEYAQKQSAAYE